MHGDQIIPGFACAADATSGSEETRAGISGTLAVQIQNPRGCAGARGGGPVTWPYLLPGTVNKHLDALVAAGWLSIDQPKDGTLVVTPAVPGTCVCDCPDGERW
jgi:hypothetical protein